MRLKDLGLYDDGSYNGLLDGVCGKGVECYRMRLLDVGRGDGEGNMVKVVGKDGEMVMWNS